MQDHYHEALDVFDGLFSYIFDNLKANWSTELEAVRQQYPFEDLLYTNPMRRLTHKEAVEILRAWVSWPWGPANRSLHARCIHVFALCRARSTDV